MPSIRHPADARSLRRGARPRQGWQQVKRGNSTIEDVAAAAGVSRQTVSRVINQRTNVSADARVRVEQAIAALGYVPSLAARRMGGGRSGVLLAVAERPADNGGGAFPLGNLLVAGIAACAARGHRLMFELLPPAAHPAEAESAINAAISAVQPDGVILLPPFDLNRGIVAALAARDIPAEGLAGPPPGTGAQANPGEAAAQRLLALGHRQIGFIAALHDRHRCLHRLAGYRRALAQRGSLAHRHFVAESLPDSAAAFEQARSWLLPTIRPTAIIADTAEIALVVLRAAQSLRLAVPRDLSLLALEDHPALERCRPPVAALHAPHDALFAAACVRLIAAGAQGGGQTGGQDDDSDPGEPIPPPLTLAERASIAPAPRTV